MGHDLYRMIRDGAAPDWSAAMRIVAMVIADDALDPGQGPPGDGGWPRSRIRVRGGHGRGGEWYDGLAERTGMSERAISRALTALARAGYEMREEVGTDQRGRPVFTYAGRRALKFRVPPLTPRTSPPSTATISPPSTATISPPSTAGIAWSPDMARHGSPNMARDHAKYGDLLTPLPNPLLTPGRSRMTGPSTGPQPSADRRAADPRATAPGRSADDDDSSGQPASLNGQWDGWADRPGPGYGECPDCGRWHTLSGYGWVIPHRVPGYEVLCPGRVPAEPVPCTRCHQTGIALAAQSGLCRACVKATRAEATP